MGLPAQLQQEFVAEFKREPHLVLRATCDLTGEPGLTWLACDGSVLACFSKPAGGEFMRHDYRISEATSLEAGSDGDHLLFQARFPETEFVLRLPPSEDQVLQKLVALQPTLDSVNTLRPPAALTPHLVCAAAAYALAQTDGELAKEELDWVVAHFGNQNSFRRGGAWVLKHGFAKLLTEAARLLTPAEMETVVVCLIELGFSDNKLAHGEITMLEEWRLAAGMTEERYQRGYDTILATASVGVLVNETPAGPDWMPINLLCAGLLGVIQHHPETAERRVKALERRIQSTDAINAGQTYVEQLGADGLVTVMSGMLQPAQRRCVLANVLHEAYLDGEPSPEVAAYLQQLHDGLGVAPADFEADAQVFRRLGDTSLFRESAGSRE
ncbi:MAG: hypothetical protein FD161_3524 [Limisphaerales bacterium]|nr:MAG: hypothetical protein FD161_3524 [Limisphaerales bacterium]KAG0507657.1 MAG: hypothetical protein E1N63_3190 [Limisphaerales bacterium]TXT51776.1 MAG: hypothetical protein FD140_1417 [Limisphaerales bacterium]